jgi:hypothetical protein
MTIADLSFWEGIKETLSGRGQFRLILQPSIAIFFGARLGISDAKEGKEPFLWRLLTGHQRDHLAKEALMSVIVPFSIAIILDGILQYLALGYVRPLAAVIVGLCLIAVPYSISRALTNRIYRHGHPRQASA